jgi:hypothetical protein
MASASSHSWLGGVRPRAAIAASQAQPRLYRMYIGQQRTATAIAGERYVPGVEMPAAIELINSSAAAVGGNLRDSARDRLKIQRRDGYASQIDRIAELEMLK